jgi:hypothetical protein
MGPDFSEKAMLWIERACVLYKTKTLAAVDDLA